MDAQLKEREDNVSIYAVHPGVVNTALFDTTGMEAIPWFRSFFFKVSVLCACCCGIFTQKSGLVCIVVRYRERQRERKKYTITTTHILVVVSAVLSAGLDEIVKAK